ncbi:MAG: hypothetical protein IPM54_30470 [Polyangiaceae bacterium]|nr:hypothetical protein [Polyangiaceae bacterium]
MKYAPSKLGLAVIPALAILGCSDQVTIVPSPSPCGSSMIVQKLQQSAVEKLDLLLAIDNSPSMADKQAILALAIPDLVNRLVNPPCVDVNGVILPNPPAGPMDACPPGSRRQFDPVVDMHIGIVSSSIGGHGADACSNAENNSECSPVPNLTINDRGHLLARTDPCSGSEAPTFQNKGFLAWDPGDKYGGETIIDDGNGKGVVPALRDMVTGVGQIGCRYESQLESIYRFLVDPEPYETITAENFKATPKGIDSLLLEQRKQFLRPDSMLAILMLSDENDCSIKEYGQFYYAAQQQLNGMPVRLPRPRQECAIDPNDPCCRSCGQSQGACPDDPTCKDPNGGPGPALLTAEEDDPKLRCWDQKRRFGIDFLYSTDRYVQAFSSQVIPNRAGELVPNPIFSDLDFNDSNSNIRDSGMVYVAGIVGVPWQDIVRDPNDPKNGFKDANELNEQVDNNGTTTWDMILGDPAKNKKPLDPLMIETYEKRPGLPDASMPLSNLVNGHEWTIAKNDLQYACIFPLLPGMERDCTDPSQIGCDCSSPTNDNPLCAPNPSDNGNPTLQVRAKAYPGIRPLTVLKDLGSQAVVTSVCPVQLDDSSAPATDFGYRMAVSAMMDRLRPALGAQCLPRTLVPDESGKVSCVLVEAINSEGNCQCDPSKARRGIEAGSAQANMVSIAKTDPLAAQAGWDCYCEVVQLEGAAKEVCQHDTASAPMLNGEPVNGWCYVDASTDPPTGNPELVAACPDNEKRKIRYAGHGEARPGATLFITCGDGSICAP